MSSQGKMEAFSGKSWASWIERLGFYFVANGISAMDKKRALLLTLCGPETYEIVRALVAPRGPGDVEFDELVTILGAHFDPRPSELYSRYKFQRRDQLPDESINSYVAALKHLAGDCNFGILASATTRVTSTTAPESASQQPPSQQAAGAAATAGQPATPQRDTKLPLDVMLPDRLPVRRKRVNVLECLRYHHPSRECLETTTKHQEKRRPPDQQDRGSKQRRCSTQQSTVLSMHRSA